MAAPRGARAKGGTEREVEAVLDRRRGARSGREQGGGRGLSLKERGEERRGNRGDQGEVEATLDQEQGSI